MGFDEISPHTEYDADLLLKGWFYIRIAVFLSQALLKENQENRQRAIKDHIEAKGNSLFSTTIARPHTAETWAIPIASMSNRTQRTRTQGQLSPTINNTNPVLEIYTAYTHNESRYFDRLKRQLNILRRQGLPISCHEDEIINSTEWQRCDHLETANLILLLVNDTFLDSDFCYCERLKCAVDRHSTDDEVCCVIPILARPVAISGLEGTSFKTLDFLPANDRTIKENPDRAYAEITDYLAHKIQTMRLYLR